MEREIDLALLSRVHELYRAALAESAEARERLAQAGVKDQRIVERFGLGFAAGNLKKILPAEPRVRRALRELGVLSGRGRGRETLTGSIVVPTFDTTGRVIELVGYPKRKSIGLVGGVFNWAAMKSHPEVRLLDDPLEALREIERDDEAVMAVREWTEVTDAVFRELAPHRIVAPKKFARQLARLGIGQGAKEPEEARVENGFAASFGKRRYLVQSVSRDNPRHLRALVRAIGATPGRFHLDALDLYSAKDRASFVREASLLFGEEPGLIEADLGRLIGMAEEHISKRPGASAVEISEAARSEAMDLLRDPKLFDRIQADFSALGIVGEESNRLAGYLVATSRLMDDPLSLLVISRSAAGKSTLAEAVASLVPPEDLVRLTRLTGQALFYQKNQSLGHKLLVVEEESGVAEAAYALRVLQSAKRLAVATPHGSHEVEGPVAVLVTTTASDLNDETKSRFLVVSVDESREQTRAIFEAQRRRETGETNAREEILRRHHALQRCLRPMRVVNPFAPALTFPDHRLAARREHPKYLALIRAVAFLRQYQREEENGAVRVELEDIGVAHALADAILGQSLEDLSPPARKLLDAIHAWRPKREFTRSEVRERLGWGTGQVWRYVAELAGQEWVLDLGGKPRRYRLSWDGREGRVCLGLRPVREIPALLRATTGSLRSERKR